MRAFGGKGKTKNRYKSRFSISENLLLFLLTINISSCFMRENEVTVLRATEERVAQTSRLPLKRYAPPRLPPKEGPILKGPYLWRYVTHLHKTGHSAVENYSGVRKRRIVAIKKNVEVFEQVRLQ